MIFSFIITNILVFQVLFPPPTISLNTINDLSKDLPQEEEIETEPYHIDIDDSTYERNKKTGKPQVEDFLLDLDANGKSEKITIKSYPGFPGDQNTEVYIDSSSNPVLTEIGSFYAIKTHKMDNSNHYVTELQLQTGQSLNTLFYIYQQGKLESVPVSTENPPFWHGIISRNIPEFKDVDSDGTLELLAYYNFLYEPTRKVEVYTFTGSALQKIEEYEEQNPDNYL